MTTTREEQRDVAKKMVVVNGQSHEIMRPDISDATVASRVRMLMRDQLDHEFVCMLARDRILYLSQELDRLRASQAGGVPAGWMDMADAPRTRPIIVLTAGGRIIKAKWVIIGDDAVGWGTPDEDDPHPNCWHTGFCWASNEDEEPSDPPVGWIEIPSASPPPPATDGDALREALVAEVTRIAADCEGVADNHRKGWRNEPPTHAAMWDRLARELRNALASSPPPVPEIVAPQVVSDATADTGSASAAHLEQILPSPDLGQAAELVKPQCDNPSPAALASVPTPVSDGDSVLRKAVALVITHHVNQNRQKRRPESDSFTLKTLREALAATPVSATDAVEAEREACARVAEAFADVTARLDGGIAQSATAAGMQRIAAAIRARGTDGGANG